MPRRSAAVITSSSLSSFFSVPRRSGVVIPSALFVFVTSASMFLDGENYTRPVFVPNNAEFLDSKGTLKFVNEFYGD